MSYKHFTEIEIYAIEYHKNQGYNCNKIAEILGRDRTSIDRIIKKYSDENGYFSSEDCILKRKQIQSETNSRNRQRIKKGSRLEEFISTLGD